MALPTKQSLIKQKTALSKQAAKLQVIEDEVDQINAETNKRFASIRRKLLEYQKKVGIKSALHKILKLK